MGGGEKGKRPNDYILHSTSLKTSSKKIKGNSSENKTKKY